MGKMTQLPEHLKKWTTRRLKEAADDLTLVISEFLELEFEVDRPGTLLPPSFGREAKALLGEIKALRERVRALSPILLPAEE